VFGDIPKSDPAAILQSMEASAALPDDLLAGQDKPDPKVTAMALEKAKWAAQHTAKMATAKDVRACPKLPKNAHKKELFSVTEIKRYLGQLIGPLSKGTGACKIKTGDFINHFLAWSTTLGRFQVMQKIKHCSTLITWMERSNWVVVTWMEMEAAAAASTGSSSSSSMATPAVAIPAADTKHKAPTKVDSSSSESETELSSCSDTTPNSSELD